MKIVRRTIANGHHTGIWKQQKGWLVVDIWKLRLEFIR